MSKTAREETEELDQKVKKTKCDSEDNGGETLLCGFQTSGVLSDSAREKTIFIHGKVRWL